MSAYYTIYGISDCPACLRACADLMAHYPEKEFAFINADFAPSYRAVLKERFGVSTFPIVVLTTDCQDTLIGGHSELIEHLTGVNSEYE